MQHHRRVECLSKHTSAQKLLCTTYFPACLTVYPQVPVNICNIMAKYTNLKKCALQGLCRVLLADTAQRAPASKVTIIHSKDALIVEGDGVHDGLLRSCCRSFCRL